MVSKIKKQKEIIRIVKKLKNRKKKIVAYSGSFDILHSGHISSLKEAKSKGDILVIFLNSDKSVRLYKGSHHPINSEENRAEVLSAIEYIDYITIFHEINPKSILEKIKPDVYCNGPDWGRNCVERSVIEKNGGKIHILKWRAGLSTSKLTKKIIEVHHKPEISAVFLDRDGTLNIKQPGYVRNISQFKFMPGAIQALKRLSKTSYKIIIVTNQSGIGRKYFKEKDLKKIHQWMVKKLKEAGVKIDRIYYCPHRPEENCLCRKPRIGMFLRAVGDFKINLSKSWFVGDDDKDVISGREANIKTIKIGKKLPKIIKLEPDYYVKNLSEALNIIIKNV